MGRIFHPKHQRIGDTDIDSDFVPHGSGRSLVSVESESIEGEYFSSNSGRNPTRIYDRTNDSDSDSISYYSVDDDKRDLAPPSGDDDYDSEDFEDRDADDDRLSYTGSARSNSDSKKKPVSSKSSKSKKSDKKNKKSDKKKKKDKKSDKKKKKNKKSDKKINRLSFLGKLKGRMSSLRDMASSMNSQKKQKKRNSDLSDGDIERSESEYGRSSKNHPEDGSICDSSYDSYDVSHSVTQSESHSISHSESYSESCSVSRSKSSSSYLEDGSRQDPPLMSPSSRRNSDRRKNYENALPEVVEEEEDSQEDYRAYKIVLEPEDQSHGSFKKEKNITKEKKGKPEKENVFNIKGKGNPRRSPDAPVVDPPDAPEQTPDPISPAVFSKKVQSPRSVKSKKSKSVKSHSSALSGRHPANSRIDFAGQLVSPVAKSKEKLDTGVLGTEVNLDTEVHRLRTLVDLMMTRMELYERQSECLVETSLEHDREWKKATLQHLDETSKRQQQPSKQSETESQLSNIKNLLMERSVQDKWIRQLEKIQRGYKQRLTATENQLRSLRYEHVITNKRIIDMKKNGGVNLSESAHTPETEDFTKSSKTEKASDEALTPLANNSSGHRWADLEDTNNAISNEKDTKEAKTVPSLLEEMIVSWHQHENYDNISVLSERGVSKKKKKKDKKKKKKKGTRSKTGSVASSVFTSSERRMIGQELEIGLYPKSKDGSVASSAATSTARSRVSQEPKAGYLITMNA